MQQATSVEILEVLHPEKYRTAKLFFRGFGFYATFLYSILEQRNLGTVFTDSCINPSLFLVCSPSTEANLNAPVYIAGELSLNSVNKVIAFLKAFPKISVVVPTDWKYKSYFSEAGFKSIERVQFKRPIGSFDVELWKRALSNVYTISEINEANFAECNWRPYILSCYGDSFFKNGVGFCILDQGKVIAESYGLFIADGKAEIGVITDSKYRGQNLGTIVSALILDYCYKNDLEPYWNCDMQNPASAAVAKKLGFEEENTYLFLRWISP